MSFAQINANVVATGYYTSKTLHVPTFEKVEFQIALSDLPFASDVLEYLDSTDKEWNRYPGLNPFKKSDINLNLQITDSVGICNFRH